MIVYSNMIRKNIPPRIMVAVLLLGVLIASIESVMAHCPLCTGATIIGVGVTRSFGLDDSLVGVFVGGMIVSSALWVNNILKKRNIAGSQYLRIGSITLATFVLTLLTFYYAGLFGLGNEYRIFGMERIILGTLSGTMVSLGAFWASNILKQRNEGKTLFPYQTMLLTLIALILNTAVLWVAL